MSGRAGASLEGRSVVVTGGAGGLGRAYALAAAAAGATVTLGDLDADAVAGVVDEITAAGGEGTGYVGSVADWASAAELIDTAVTRYGRLDGLVNNAGVFHAVEPWAETEVRARALIEVNVLGTLFCGTHALRVMYRQGSGSIVNVTSGSHLGIPEMGTYGASKGAAASVTYSWALDAAEYGVRVNAVSPVARTGQSLLWANRDAEHADEPPPERIAPLVVYLLSDAARHVSGQVVRLDARGVSALVPPRFGPVVTSTEAWTADSLAAAIEGDLSAAGRPVGLAQRPLRPAAALSGPGRGAEGAS